MKHSCTVPNKAAAKLVVRNLWGHWFSVSPLPDGTFEITVEQKEAEFLTRLVVAAELLLG